MANLYVRKAGSDSNNGSTAALAKLTIGSAVTAASAGDNVYVGAGVYKEAISAAAKQINIIGDITGASTGDAGEVILSGLNATDDGFGANFTHDLSSGGSLQNLIFSDWYTNTGTSLIYCNTPSNAFSVTDCKFVNIMFGTGLQVFVFNWNSGTGALTLKRCGFYNCWQYGNNNFAVVRIWDGASATKPVIENVEVAFCGVAQNNTSATVFGFRLLTGSAGTWSIKNCSVHDCSWFDYASNGSATIAFSIEGSFMPSAYNCSVYNILSYNFATNYGFKADNSCTAYNCNVFNTKSAGSGTNTAYSTITNSGGVAKSPYPLPPVALFSRFSPLAGAGNATGASDDIFGNPRPAYGNTNGSIGTVEATFNNVQRDTVAPDAGTYDLRVNPPQYFKRTFQIPVTASTARTVTVKIRIDGTWPAGSRPKVTLSGQGMTLSIATKNSTTGSYEQLSVSGTPSTTGLATLTIEAHATNTDADMHVDTIALS